MTEILRDNLSKTAKTFLGAGIGFIVAWAAVTFVPSNYVQWAIKEPGKTILFYLQLGLFIAALIGIVIVFSILPSYRKLKIKSIKFKDIELNFDDKEKVDEQS